MTMPRLHRLAQVRTRRSVAFRQWLAHPEQAPGKLRPELQKLRSLRKSGTVSGHVAQAFNGDTLGLPQNEESITSCRSRASVVLGGTNDYRGLIDAEGNFT